MPAILQWGGEGLRGPLRVDPAVSRQGHAGRIAGLVKAGTDEPRRQLLAYEVQEPRVLGDLPCEEVGSASRAAPIKRRAECPTA